VHREVKPSDVLVDHRGHCYLTDFGLSRTAADRSAAAEVSLAGTVDRQCRGHHGAGPPESLLVRVATTLSPD
jgi:serine/threonine protein kinase